MINTLTPALFARYPDASALAQADPAELEPMIFKSGFFRQKAKSLIAMAQALVERHGGEVPRTIDELVQVRGVGRKTANVVLGNALDVHEGVVVDTHVTRLAQRLGLTTNTDPVTIEQDLMELLPRDQWTSFANRLIWHGRRVCHAKKPDHDHCILAPICPSATLVTLPSTRRPSKAPPRPGKPTKIGRAAKKVAKAAKAAVKKTKRS